MSHVTTRYPGTITHHNATVEGWKIDVFVTPLTEHVRGGDAETHAVVTVFSVSIHAVAVVMATRGFLARSYFDEKLGSFFAGHELEDAVYVAVAEALGRPYEGGPDAD